MSEHEQEFVVEGEIDVQNGHKKIRVYDSDGDFFIEVPSGSKVTFGYFNPSRDEGGAFQRGGGYDRPSTAKTTALRIYEKGEKGNQLACFLGVKGFRDEAIKLTRLQQKVTITQNFEDDEGEGLATFTSSRQKQITAVAEGGYQ